MYRLYKMLVLKLTIVLFLKQLRLTIVGFINKNVYRCWFFEHMGKFVIL